MRDDGGPAFPRPHSQDDHRGEQGCWAQDGMTLRDYFAAHAPDIIENSRHSWESEARSRYAYADAMLAERSKT